MWRYLPADGLGTAVARPLAGQVSDRGDFIATWVHDLMFFDAEPWVFTVCYCSFGAAVVLSWLMVPPRRRGVGKPGQ